MAEYGPTSIDWIILVLTCVLATMFLYEAWENVVNRRLSRYGLDAVLASLSIGFGGEAVRQRVRKATSNPKRMVVAGLYALSLGIGALYVIFTLLRSWYLH